MWGKEVRENLQEDGTISYNRLKYIYHALLNIDL